MQPMYSLNKKLQQVLNSVGKLQKGYTVTVLRKSGSWHYIQYRKTKGYVYLKYISGIK